MEMSFVITVITFVVIASLNITHALKTSSNGLDLYDNFQEEQTQSKAIYDSMSPNFSLTTELRNLSSFSQKFLDNLNAPILSEEKLRENYSEMEGSKLNKLKLLRPSYLIQVNGLVNEKLKKYNFSELLAADTELNYITNSLDDFHVNDLATERLIAADNNKELDDKILGTKIINNNSLLDCLPLNIDDNSKLLIMPEILNKLNDLKSETRIKNVTNGERFSSVTRVPTDLAVLDYNNDNPEIQGMKWNDISDDNCLFKRFCKINNLSDYINISNPVVNKNINDFANLNTEVDKYDMDEENIKIFPENLNEFGCTSNYTLPEENIYSLNNEVMLRNEKRPNIVINRDIFVRNFPSVKVLQVSSLNMTGRLKPVILQVADISNNSNQSLNKLNNFHYIPLYEVENFEKLSKNNHKSLLLTIDHNTTSSVGTTNTSIFLLNRGYRTTYSPFVNQIKFSNTTFITDSSSSSLIARTIPEATALDTNDKTTFLSSVTNFSFVNNLTFLSSEKSRIRNSTTLIATLGILPINASYSLPNTQIEFANPTAESSLSSPVPIKSITKSFQVTHPEEVLKQITYNLSAVPAVLTSNLSTTFIADKDLSNTTSNNNSLNTASSIWSTYSSNKYFSSANVSRIYLIGNTTLTSAFSEKYNQSVKEIRNSSSSSTKENTKRNRSTNSLTSQTIITTTTEQIIQLQLYRIRNPVTNGTLKSTFPAQHQTEGSKRSDFNNSLNRSDEKIQMNLDEYYANATLAVRCTSQTTDPFIPDIEIIKISKGPSENKTTDSTTKHFNKHANRVTTSHLLPNSSEVEKFRGRRVFHFDETSAIPFTLQHEQFNRNRKLKNYFYNRANSKDIDRVKNRKIIKRIRKNDNTFSSWRINDISAESDNKNILENSLSDEEIASLNNGFNENLIDDDYDHARYFLQKCSTFYKDNSSADLDIVSRRYRENMQSGENISKSYFYYDDIEPDNSFKDKSPEKISTKKIEGSIKISFADNRNEKEHNRDFNERLLEDDADCNGSCPPINNNTTLFDFLVINFDVESAAPSLNNSNPLKSTNNYFPSFTASPDRNKTNSKYKYYNKIKLFNRNGKVRNFNLTDLKKIIKEEDKLKEKCEANGDKCVCSFDSELIEKNVSAASSISSGSICKSFIPVRKKFIITNDILPRIIKFDDKNDSDEKIMDETNFVKLFMSSSSFNEAKDEKGAKKGNKVIKVLVLVGNRIELPCTPNETHNLAESNTTPKYSWNYGDNTPCCEGDQVHINANGKLVIESVTAQYEILTCTFSYNDPETQKVQNITTFYHLKVLMIPILRVISKIHYRTTAPCNDTLLEMIELFLPQLIEKDICHYNENNDICYLTVKSAQCSKTKEPEGTDLLVNYHTSLTPVKTLLTNKDDKSCNCLCLEMLSLKLFVSLNRSVATALTVPAETSTKAELNPAVQSMSRSYSIGCGAGFQLDRTFCVTCDIGTYSKEGSAYCHPCSKGMYQPKKGSGACIPCPNHFVPGCLYLVLESQSIAGTKWVLGILFLAIILTFSFFCYRKCFKKRYPCKTAVSPE